METEMIGLFIQIPIVGAFIYFTVTLLKSFQNNQKEIHQQALLHEINLQDELFKHLDVQNQRWENLLTLERERRKEAMLQGLREIEVLVKSLEALSISIAQQTERLSRHDEAALLRHSELIRTLNKS